MIVYSPLNLLISSSLKNCKSDLNTLILVEIKKNLVFLVCFKRPSSHLDHHQIQYLKMTVLSILWSEVLKAEINPRPSKHQWQTTDNVFFFHLTLHCRQVRALEEALAYWAILNKSLPHKWCPLLNSSTTALTPLTLKPGHIHTSQLQTAIAQANPSWQRQSTIAAASPRRCTSPVYLALPQKLLNNILPSIQTQAFTERTGKSLIHK